MNESEFRDWIRNRLLDLDERLKRVEARPAEGSKLEVPAKIRGDMAALAAKLLEEARAGRLAGLAIAYLTEDGVPMTGWAEGSHGAFSLAGAAAFVGLEMLDSVRQAEAEKAREAAA
jgi:hypothetical protein